MIRKLINFLKNKFAKIFVLTMCLIVGSGCLMSCDSGEPSINNTDIRYSVEREGEYQSKIFFEITVYNNYHKDIESVEFRFSLYNYNNIHVGESKIFKTDTFIEHRSKEFISGSFTYANPNIYKIELENFTPSYVSFWDTYQYWFYGILAALIVSLIAFYIFMVIDMMDSYELFNVCFFYDYGWVFVSLPVLALIIFTCIIPVHGVGWVPLAMLACAIVIFLLAAYLGCFIYNFIENIYLGVNDRTPEPLNELYGYAINIKFEYEIEFDEKNGLPQEEYIKEVKNRFNDRCLKMGLKNCTMNELTIMCRLNSVKGYSNLRKEDLIKLLENLFKIEDHNKIKAIPAKVLLKANDKQIERIKISK